MHKIFCFINGKWGHSDVVSVALGDDGTRLGSHVSSNIDWAKSDIGSDGQNSYRNKDFDAHFGAGNWVTEWVDNPRTHEGVIAAMAIALESGAPSKGSEHSVMVVVSE